jgi:hypothetical protein
MGNIFSKTNNLYKNKVELELKEKIRNTIIKILYDKDAIRDELEKVPIMNETLRYIIPP